MYFGLQEATIAGYKAQCALMIGYLDRLVGQCCSAHESVLCEGVHLNVNLVVKLMQKYPNIVPFLAYIKNENRQAQRHLAVFCIAICNC